MSTSELALSTSELAASVMCADFGCLRRDLTAIRRAGIRRLHLDFGDGQFVPNFPLGMEVFRAISAGPRWEIESHLMIEEPARLIDLFVPFTDLIIVHLEAMADPRSTIKRIRAAARRVGVAANPATPADALFPWLADVDEVLVMAVEPGFSGGRFVPSTVDKVYRIRHELDRIDRSIPIEVDGAVSVATARVMALAGASRFVGGTSGLFREGGIEQNARHLLSAIRRGIEDQSRTAHPPLVAGEPSVVRRREETARGEETAL